MGVRRALSLCMDLVRSGKKPIYTLGPIIHNSIVTKKLESFGVRSVKDLSEIEPDSYVLVRSHGITPKLRAELVQKGFNICDATCPKVARVQAIIRSHVNQGYSIVIIGDHGHAETQGLLGYADEKGSVLENIKEVESFIQDPNRPQRICVVAQTTQEPLVFHDFCKRLSQHFKDIKIIDTICDATRKRQEEVHQNASCYDCVIIAGGKNSANTTRLFETAARSCKKAFHIEDSSGLKDVDTKDCSSILITAGASTPFWIMHEIKDKIEKNGPAKYLVRTLSSKWFGILSFIITVLYSMVFFRSAGVWIITFTFLAAAAFVVGLFSMYMGRLDMFEKKLPYAELAVAGWFLTLTITSQIFKVSLIPALLYYCLLFYVVYKNKAVAMRIVIAMLNLSFWIILGGIGYGK